MKKLYFYSFICLSFLCLASCIETSSYASAGLSYEYKLGETMTFVPNLPANVDSVEYYINDKHIATYTEMPFVLRYKLDDYKTGDYSLKYKMYYNDIEQQTKYSKTTTTTISIY